jgi:DNA polymerase
MAKGYGVNLPEVEIDRLCGGWRQAHPHIVNAWRAIERHAAKQIRSGAKPLGITLPSARVLYYPGAEIRSDGIWYNSVENGKWLAIATYGGKLFENYVQATARDILAAAMLRLNGSGFRVVLHVHDEVVCEVPYESDFNLFLRIMAEVPAWAKGLPIAVSGWRSRRYRKG